MSRRGNCHDNAVAGSFFGSLKAEWVKRKTWVTRDEAREAVHDDIEVSCHGKRCHSVFCYVSPVEFENGGGEHGAA